MNVADLVCAMEGIAPLRYAEQWDNVGLLVGAPDREIEGPVLVAVDLTLAVLAEAREKGAGAIVAYHPPIFRPLKRLDAATAKTRALLGAIEQGMAIYSPHTALDAAPGGLTDWLCDALNPAGSNASIGDRRALDPVALPDDAGTHKVVTFVPREHVDRVRDALSSIGAGRIGLYEQCAFMIDGRGTFRGGEGTNPVVGESGRLETAEEVRLEMVCPASALGLAREMLEQFHPYEEPPWDVYALTPKPDRSCGPGRRVTLDRPAMPAELIERVKANLGIPAVKLAKASDEPVSRVGVCAGSGASLLDAAIGSGCQLFFTGEMDHHEGLDAVSRGCSVLLAGHTNTERGYMPTLAARINEALPAAQAFASVEDKPLFRSY